MAYDKSSLKVPKGFAALLEKLATEVLREQPSDIVRFSAAYFRDLVKDRELTGKDPISAQIELEKSFSKVQTTPLRPYQKNKISYEHRVQSAVKIQSTYRGHAARKRTKQIKVKRDYAARKIQNSYRGWHSHKEYSRNTEQTSSELQQKHAAATKIQARYKGYHVRKQKLQVKKRSAKMEQEAATKIQACYKGYHVRKHQKHLNDCKNESDASSKHTAATKIQAHYKGYRVRNQKQLKDVSQESDTSSKHTAAIKIQAHYKGYRVRKQKQSKNVSQRELEVGEKFVDPSEESKAAVKIQSRYRGHVARKKMKQYNQAAQTRGEDEEDEQGR